VTGLLYLIPAALALGLLGLVAFLWTLRSGQYEDLEGSAQRILFDDDEAEQSASAPMQQPDQAEPSPH
jgi:cbb3-type cytochrome oxidase maturation protein